MKHIASILSVTVLAAQVSSQSLPLAWGPNPTGALGNGSFKGSILPLPVSTNDQLAGLKVVALASGWKHSAAVTDDGRAFFWGQSIIGTISDGIFINYPLPTVVDSSGILAGKVLERVTVGRDFTLALDSLGLVYSWGVNGSGQLGDGTVNPARSPVAVKTNGILAGQSVVAMAAGGYHCLVVTSGGQVAGWGDDTVSQLGDGGGFGSQRYSPVWTSTNGVLAGVRVKSVAAGEYHSLALSSLGLVYSWGRNLSGQLGTGNNLNQNYPVAVDVRGVLSNKVIVSISSGLSHSVALSADGELFAWGDNQYGQLGDGTKVARTSPVAVRTDGVLKDSRIVSVASFAAHNLALTSDGVLVAWGINSGGRLGAGTVVDSPLPVVVSTNSWLSGRTATILGGGATGNHSLVSVIPGPPLLAVTQKVAAAQIELKGLSNTLYRIENSRVPGKTSAWTFLTNVVTDALGRSYITKPLHLESEFWRGEAAP
jgi:alpha-tubulin suppressor-like RCC1 family protein